MADRIGASDLGSAGLAGGLLREPPTVTITAPVGPQPTSTVTVSWTYSSPLSKTQSSYRVRVLDQYGGVTLYDSGTIPGADTSFACPFLLSGGSLYQLQVTLSDGLDTSTATGSFSSSLSSLPDWPIETGVGSIYEVAINGLGYRLADTPERPYKRSSGQLQAPRYATGETPFSEAVERYSFVGSSDWSYGAGQRFGNRNSSDPRAYFDSENVNPFDGPLELLNVTTEVVADATDAVVASGALFAKTAADTVKRLTSSAAAADTMTFTGDTLIDLASDGTNWYAANNDDEIFKGSATTIGTAWTDLSAQGTVSMVEWATDRLVAVYTNASSQAVFSTLAPDGTEETVAGRFKFDDASITAVTSGDGYVWFSVNRGDRSVVRAWQLGSTDASFVAVELPKGEYVTELHFYLGNVMIRAARDDGGTIYRAVPSNGELTPDRVVELDGNETKNGGFVGLDRFVLFAWEAMGTDGRSGVGAIDLSTGGWCRWLEAATAADTGAVSDLFVWEGVAGFVTAGSGVMFTDPDTLCAEGFVTSSVMDLASSLVKVIDSVAVNTEPLAADSSVAVAISTDSGVSFTEAGSLTVAGIREGRWSWNEQAMGVAIRLTLTATGVASPKVSLTQVKLHPLSLVDQILELPISCADRQSGLNGVEITDSVGGLDRARLLESLVGTRVQLQDVDWPSTGETQIWEMVATEFTSVGVFERGTGARQEARAVCVCTLRRAQ